MEKLEKAVKNYNNDNGAIVTCYINQEGYIVANGKGDPSTISTMMSGLMDADDKWREVLDNAVLVNIGRRGLDGINELINKLNIVKIKLEEGKK